MDDIVLIGMPGSGKSTVGVLLAKALGCLFTDVDLLISHRAKKPLQRILDEDGLEAFLALEEEVGSRLRAENTVIATGGSMVISDKAMRHLKTLGTVVYIDVPFEEIERRVTNIKTRGIVFHPNQTLADVYRERKPLYERWADLTVKVEATDGIEDTVDKVISML
ncbi:MAG: shikimate kinase [Ruminococcus sp.]|nr:shikimate kinase [Ruminococcus sp.]